jgi:hypothetical protein
MDKVRSSRKLVVSDGAMGIGDGQGTLTGIVSSADGAAVE